MRIDDSLKIATALLTGHMATTPIATDDVMGLLHKWHRDIMRMQSGSYATWVGEMPPSDLLDEVVVEPVEPKIYPPPQHPLAAHDVSIEDKIAGTQHEKHIVCLECGKSVKLMKSHLLSSHNGMTWAEYLDRHGLSASYLATPPWHAEQQSRKQWAIHKPGEPYPGDVKVGVKTNEVSDEVENANGEKKHQPVSVDFPRRGNDAGGGGELGKTG